MGLFGPKGGLRTFPANKRIDLVSVGSSFIAALLFAGFQTKYEWFLDRVDRELATPLRIVCALSIGAAVFALFEFANYWRISRSLRRTLRHYLRLLKDVTPLGACPTNCSEKT